MHKLHLDRGEAHVLEALRLSPRDAMVFGWLGIAGYAEDYLGRYEEAVMWQRRSIDANPNYPTSHFHLAIALAHLGRLEEARAAARVGLALDSHFTIASFLAANKFSDSPPISGGASARRTACARQVFPRDERDQETCSSCDR